MISKKLSKIFKLNKSPFQFSSLNFYDYPTLNMPINFNIPPFSNNKESITPVIKEFEERLSSIINYQNPTSFSKLKKRNKLPVRDRITKILDEDSPFLELSQLAGYEMYGKVNIN